ncbi:MAG: two-component system sensor histidine kinase NtrB [bacterium]
MAYKSRFKSIFHGVVDIISLIDTDYNILMVNEAYERLLKKTSDECIGEKCYSIIRHRETPCEDCPILDFKKMHGDTGNIIISIGNDNVSISRHPVFDNNGKFIGVFEIGRIITKELKMEQELQHHGRLKLMGKLAASIVHEIKNPLVGIGLMAISIKNRLKETEIKDDIHEDMESIIHEVQRLERLLENLMDFGKPSIFLTKKEDIHHPINETLKLLNKKLKPAGIKVHKVFDREIPLVMIDLSKIQQVFLNIFLNAVDAMQGGGEITIKTGRFQEDIEEDVTEHWVEVTIQDNGTGIKEEYLPYIFDPFYSKSHRKTGLGLSVVSRIIDLHCGRIKIQSREGQGTKVKIYLPIA